MELLILPFFVFLELLKWLIFIEIILSWVALLGVFIAIPFISTILQPMFQAIRRILPVQFLGLDFAPLILLIAIQIVQGMLLSFAPLIRFYIPSILF